MLMPPSWKDFDFQRSEILLFGVGLVLFLAAGKYLLGSRLYASSFIPQDYPQTKILTRVHLRSGAQIIRQSSISRYLLRQMSHSMAPLLIAMLDLER